MKVSCIPEHCEISSPGHPVVPTFLGQQTICGVEDVRCRQGDLRKGVTGQLSHSGTWTCLPSSHTPSSLSEEKILVQKMSKKGWLASSFSSSRSSEIEGGRTNFRLPSLVRGLLGTQMHLKTAEVRTMKDASFITFFFCVWDANVDQVIFVSSLGRFSQCTAVGNLQQNTLSSNRNWHLKVVYTHLKAWAM